MARGAGAMLAAAFLAAPTNAARAWRQQAAGAAGADESHTHADLLAEDAWIQPGRPFWVAIRLRMDEGWHTYWRNPGDSGLPTRVRWELPRGFEAGPLRWPAPERIELLPLVNFGYEREAGLVAVIQPPEELWAAESVLRARVEWVECAEVCVPGAADVELKREVRREPPTPDPADAPIVAAARDRLPKSGAEWGARASASGPDLRITVVPPKGLAAPIVRMDFFPEEPGQVENTPRGRMTRTPGGYTLRLRRDAGRETAGAVHGVLVAERRGERGERRRDALELDVPVREFPSPGGKRGARPAIWVWAAAGGFWILRRVRASWKRIGS